MRYPADDPAFAVFYTAYGEDRVTTVRAADVAIARHQFEQHAGNWAAIVAVAPVVAVETA